MGIINSNSNGETDNYFLRKTYICLFDIVSLYIHADNCVAF